MFTVHFPLDQITTAIRSAQNELQQDKQNLLNQAGVQVLSLSQQAYREKARGGQGSDGITWAPLSRRTLEARVRRRNPGKRIVAKRRQLAKQIKTAIANKAKRRAKERRGRRLASARANELSDRLIQNLREQRSRLKDELEALVDAEAGRHEIGVDTGLQRASAQPGFVPQDGQGGNVMDLTPGQITVGYGREYSRDFDRRRQLLPATLPQAWQQKVDDLAQRWADGIVRRITDQFE